MATFVATRLGFRNTERLTRVHGRGYMYAPMQNQRTDLLRFRVFAIDGRLFRKAAKIAGVDFSEFARRALLREVERMRAEGKKL